MPLSRRNITIALLSLVVLRVVVGFHFFFQGTDKLKSGDFSSAGFLASARGPLAPWFHRLVDDFDGHMRLCIVTTPTANGDPQYRIDIQLTKSIWEAYIEQATDRFEFDATTTRSANQLLENSLARLNEFFLASEYVGTNEDEILVWAHEGDRLNGFARDGGGRLRVARGVESLSGQIDTIRDARRRKAAPWLAQIESIWDHLEDSVNHLAGCEPGEPALLVDRPYRERFSAQRVIDSVIPWFDCFVGGLLILGLLTRPAALAGAALLLGVVATQPFWILGSQDTFYQWIELASLLVLFAMAAGRFAGLDYFLMRRNVARGQRPSQRDDRNNTHSSDRPSREAV